MKTAILTSLILICISTSLCASSLDSTSNHEDRINHSSIYPIYTPFATFYEEPTNNIWIFSFSMLIKEGDQVYVDLKSKNSGYTRDWEIYVYGKNHSGTKKGVLLESWVNDPTQASSYNQKFQTLSVTGSGGENFKLITFLKDFRKDDVGGQFTRPADALNIGGFRIILANHEDVEPDGQTHSGGAIHLPKG